MPQSPCKVFARIFNFRTSDTPADGVLTFTIEWKLLVSPYEGGKFVVTPDPILTDDRLKDDLRDALSAYLSEKYSIELRPRDFVGYSV